MTLDELLTVGRAAAEEGCRLLRTAEPGKIAAKGDRDFVTDLDLRIQKKVCQFLSIRTPDVGFIGEEAGEHEKSDHGQPYRWILDPIDGTSNFIHGIPMCAVSLALVHKDIPVIGIIKAPFLNLEYHASAGQGAFSNDVRIGASRTSSLEDAIVSIGDYAVGVDASEENRRRFALTTALAERVERVRMIGSAALDLAWVADGRLDGCVMLSNKPWDTAAGVLIARESGAVVTDSDGSEHSLTAAHTIAASPAIAPLLLDLVATTR
ncbi:inositol monophosphatase family protein [Nocardia anaemiae]|uniref:inositol monophosphatase family protein n=1 Tax=Nocardia anaemiae TaxID=263910 RepID=UPI0007A4FC55|nr:inositol monophosphatase family protein [Nocardia anaemiae]